MEDELSDQFDDEMLKLYERMKLAGFQSSPFLSMVREHGGAVAAKRLINRSKGMVEFDRLVDLHKLQLTDDALGTRQNRKLLFTPEAPKLARDRLNKVKPLET